MEKSDQVAIVSAPVGFGWRELLNDLSSTFGSLAAVAQQLAANRGYKDEIDTIERGLRRLRGRGQLDGGVWGQRVLRCFGLPRSVEDRVRWMGQYHTRFTDLPGALCRDLLNLWNRPPVSESAARIWVQLGLCSLALRVRDMEEAQKRLQQARQAAPRAEAAAKVELELITAYTMSRVDRSQVERSLSAASALIKNSTQLSLEDRACLKSRLVDQRAYEFNRPPKGKNANPEAALVLYENIPTEGAPPFALCRRENGLGWTKLTLGDREAAIGHAEASVRHAGDGGLLRLRAMALNLLAVALGGEKGAEVKGRALSIAGHLEDEELRIRFERVRK